MELVHSLVHVVVGSLEAVFGRGDLASGESHEVRQACEADVIGVESVLNVVDCPLVQRSAFVPGPRVENMQCVCVCVCARACVSVSLCLRACMARARAQLRKIV